MQFSNRGNQFEGLIAGGLTLIASIIAHKNDQPRVVYISSQEDKKEIRQKTKEIEEKNRIIQENEKKAQIENEKKATAEKDFSSQIQIKIKEIQSTVITSLKNTKHQYLSSDLPLSEINRIKSLMNTIFIKHQAPERLKQFIKTNAQKTSLNLFALMEHFNIVIVGKTGVGKSTLINQFLRLDQKTGAKTGIGLPITKQLQGYESKVMPTLRLWDTRGIELKEYGIDSLVETVTKLVDDRAKDKNPDSFIHAIWYCIASSSNRCEKDEKDAILKLIQIYEGSKLPIIIVMTKSYDDDEVKALKQTMEDFIPKSVSILDVLAQKKFQIEPYGLDILLKETVEKARKATAPAYHHSIILQIKEEFEQLENKVKQKAESTSQKIINQKQKEINPETMNIDSMINQLFCMFESITGEFFDFDNSSSMQETKQYLQEIMNIYIRIAQNNIMLFKHNTIAHAEQNLSKIYGDIYQSIENSTNYALSFSNYEPKWNEYAKNGIAQCIKENLEYEAFDIIADLIKTTFIKCISEVFKEGFNQTFKEMTKIIEEVAQNEVNKVTDTLFKTAKECLI